MVDSVSRLDVQTVTVRERGLDSYRGVTDTLYEDRETLPCISGGVGPESEKVIEVKESEKQNIKCEVGDGCSVGSIEL